MQDPNYVISILGYEFNEVNRYEFNAIFEKVVELVLNLCRMYRTSTILFWSKKSSLLFQH